jgi:hypothetical protein
MLDWASRGVTPGRQGWSKAAEISGGVARLGRRWGGREEVADMWVPHVSDRGERRRCGWKEKAHSR